MASPVSGPPRPRNSKSRTLLAIILSLAYACRAATADYSPSLDDNAQVKYPMSTLLSAGGVFAIGSDLGLLPHLACFRDLPHSWQVGLDARIATHDAKVAYDYRPLIGLNVRKLWIGEEDVSPIRNSEYFGVTLGGYFAYDFEGTESGLNPFGTLSMGKYWMPFDTQPYGLDLNLELTRFISGHLPGRSELVFITLGASLFYALP